MTGLATTLVDWLLALLGFLSLLVLGSGSVYLLVGLVRRRRHSLAALSLLVLLASFSPPGVWSISIACGLVVTIQAACYAYFAVRSLLRGRRQRTWREPLPTVTLVVPAKDEAAVIADTLRALDGLDYPDARLELVLIDDGSSDDTAAVAEAAALGMRRSLRLIRHATSAGKARRLNELVPTLNSDFVLLLDADHWPERELIQRMLGALAERPEVGCVQVASAVRNGGTNALTKALELEYLFRCRGIYPGKPMGVFVGSGGLFRRSALLALGGFDPSMLTEDVEISYRLYKHGLRVVYDDTTASHDLAVTDFKNFFNQRHRWMRGVWQALLLHLRESPNAGIFPSVRAHFVQFTCDGLSALCLCVLEMYFLLGQLGLVAFQLAFPIYVLMASCTFAFSVGFLRGNRLGNLLFLPLVPLYMIAHTIPTWWALIDSYILDKPVVWVKTERASAPHADVGLSGGRA